MLESVFPYLWQISHKKNVSITGYIIMWSLIKDISILLMEKHLDNTD